MFDEYDVVRVKKLLTPSRPFSGTEGATRSPQIGDKGTIVFLYDQSLFIIECVDKEGYTVWLADFEKSELALVYRPE